MKLNQKLINDLREGKIVLKNEPKNPEVVKEILKEAFPTLKFGEDFFKRETYALRGTDGLPKIPIADFLRPEPKFKVGDKVIVTGPSIITKAEIKEVKQHPDTGNWAYMVSDGMTGCFVSEGLLQPALEPKFKVGDRVIHKESTGNNSFIVHHINWWPDLKDFCYYPEKGIGIAEFALVYAKEPQFEVGKCYEFGYAGSWFKGILLAIHKDKYIADTSKGANIQVDVYPRIRLIQPKPVKVERWANVFPSGYISKRIYSTEAKAKENGNSDCKQVKLEGTYYADPNPDLSDLVEDY